MRCAGSLGCIDVHLLCILSISGLPLTCAACTAPPPLQPAASNPHPHPTIEDLNAAGIIRARGQVLEAFGAQLRYAKIKYNSLANYMVWLAAQPQ